MAVEMEVPSSLRERAVSYSAPSNSHQPQAAHGVGHHGLVAEASESLQRFVADGQRLQAAAAGHAGNHQIDQDEGLQLPELFPVGLLEARLVAA